MSKIEIYVKEPADLFEKWNPKRLSRDLIDYIAKEMKKCSVRESVEIEVIMKNALSKEEKDALVDFIRSHYGLAVQREKKLQNVRKIKKYLLLLCGILLIAFSTYLSKIFVDIIPELFLIAGWVVVWEFVYELLFTDIFQRVTILQERKLASCPIHFKKKTGEEVKS